MIFIAILIIFFFCAVSELRAIDEKVPSCTGIKIEGICIAIMPTQETVKEFFAQHFDKYGLKSFTEHTNIIQDLAGKALSLKRLLSYAKCAVLKYKDFLLEPLNLVEMHKLYVMFHEVFIDNQEKLEDLQNNRIAFITAFMASQLEECINEILADQPEMQQEFNRMIDVLLSGSGKIQFACMSF